eukprot:m.84380 g.84380  ORF g.84380 m.84380 type:complete len:1004 (+) comp12964_c0_seq1:176-3187(+)
MAPAGRRGNSMIRGNGHTLGGLKAQRGSILRRVSVHKGKQTEEDIAVFDMVLLSKIDEESVVNNIKNMYFEDHIYVYIGNVVISVNPFKNLPIYDQATIDKYRGRSAFDPKLPPHVYALADNVFSDMRWRARNQVVIISGESGAGKTEASKKVMQYVAAVSGSSDKVNRIKDKLLTTNPVLESFGNAKTTRNDNSSRFGKYMDIQFDFKGEPCGGHIVTYLLEKARVIHQAKGERSFHIFYQIFASGMAKSLGMSSNAMSHLLLNQGGEEKVKGIQDESWFKDVEKGLQNVDFSDEDRKLIWQTLVGVIGLGELKFKSDGKTGSKIENVPPYLEKVLMTSAKDIEHGLSHNTVVVNGSQVSADLDPVRAADARGTLCKSIYQRLFSWICERINKSIAADDRGIKAVIGVLDIYGFEIFSQNGFEQFCINYCNEKLQQLFIELTLKTEQDEYVREGVKWTPIDYFNNKVICDLIDSKRNGIVSSLDEESIRPGDKSDAIWLEKMGKALGKHDHFQVRSGAADKSLPADAFKLKHYAGDVVYTVTGFMEKNTDTLFKDLARLMFKSKNKILVDCFPEGDEKLWAGASKRPETAGRRFINSMHSMIDMLNTKVPSYIRCIKPNHTKASKNIDEELFRHQVKYLGLLENVRVRRAGYCFRETYKDFMWRYRMLSEKTYPRWSGSDKDGTVEIMKSLGCQNSSYQLGKTKIFIKHPKEVFRLEEERDTVMDQIATKLQMGWRLYLVRKTIGGWFSAMNKQFEPVKKLDGNNPVYGFSPSKTKFPKHQPQLKTCAKFLTGVYASWWARKMVGPLAEQKRNLMRLQLNAHTLLSGHKKGFSLKTATFTSLYAEDEANQSDKFVKTQGKIIFSESVQKINKKGKEEERILVVTEKNIYLTKNFAAAPKRTFPIDKVQVLVSKGADTVVVIKGPQDGNDWVLNFGPNHVPEILVRISGGFGVAKGGKVTLGDSIKYNNSGKPNKDLELKLISNPAGSTERSVWSKQNMAFLY